MQTKRVNSYILSFTFLTILIVLTVASSGCSEKQSGATSISERVSFMHLEGYLAAPPAINDGFMYAATGSGSLLKLEMKSGSIVWTYSDIGGFINNTPVLTEDSVVVIGSQGRLVAIDKDTGEKKWEKPDKSETEWTVDNKKLGMPTVTGCFGYDSLNKIIVMGDTQGNIFGISPLDGSIIWLRELNTKIIASPQFRDQAVFLATMGGRLHALHVHDGSDYWDLPKVKVIGVKGAIQIEKEEKSEALKKNYVVLIRFKYNFDPSDYFGHKEKSEKSNIEIALFDENKLPIKYDDKGIEQDLIMIKEIDPGKHIGSGTQTQIHEITLVDTPNKEKDWPLSVVVKDSEGNIIDTLETEISFESSEEKKEEL